MARSIPSRSPAKNQNGSDPGGGGGDAQASDANGEFLTERLEPGTYEFVGELYLPLTPAQQRFSGIPTPRYVGKKLVVVPESGNMPELVIELLDTQKN